MSQYAAVIVENRPEINLKAVIDRHMPYLPGWKLEVIADASVRTISDFNRLMTSKEFWEPLCKYERVLIFQHDSGLLRTGIEEFLEWDFIGAPIEKMPGNMNGGLSLRNPRKMLHIIENYPYRGMSHDGNEDIYSVNRMRQVGAKLPMLHESSYFSVETMFFRPTIGYHAIHKYLSPESCEKILNYNK